MSRRLAFSLTERLAAGALLLAAAYGAWAVTVYERTFGATPIAWLPAAAVTAALAAPLVGLLAFRQSRPQSWAATLGPAALWLTAKFLFG